MEKIETLIDLNRGRTAHYPTYCSHFLERAKPLDAAAREMSEIAVMFSNVSVAEANMILAKSARDHIIHVVTATKFPLKNLGWAFASAMLPLKATKDLCKAKTDAILVEQADHRVKFLAPYIGQDRVAMLLPHELRTEDAAVYMHKRERYALQAVIDTALLLG